MRDQRHASPSPRVVGGRATATLEQALRRLEGSSTAVWLVQCNPQRTDILTSSRTALPDAWCVRRHTKEIRRGDRIVLWLSGRGAGAYALGEIAADVVADRPAGGAGAGSAPVINASLDLYLDLFACPVTRTELREDPRFAGESILRQPFAANPHRLGAPALDAILERVAAVAAGTGPGG